MSDKILSFKISSGQQTREQICTKIGQLDDIIESLYNTALTSVATGQYIKYKIDTGQTKQEVEYSDVNAIHRAIDGYEKMRQRLQNKLTPRAFRLMDGKNFRR